MKEKITTNLLVNLLITFSIGISEFVVNKFFADFMGLEKLGLMKLFTQMIAYLNLVDLGISSASTYALYKPLVEKNFKKINIIVSTIDFFYKRISLLILAFGVGLSILIPYFIKSPIDNKVYFYWILYVINLSISYIYAKYIILFSANQEYGYVRKIQGSGKILFQTLQIFVLIKLQSFALFILVMILENFYSIYFYKKHFIKNYKYIVKVKEKDKNIFNDMKNLIWHKIGGVIVHNTDYILLSKYVSLSVVGIYSSYLMVYQIIMTLINIITTVITPKIGVYIVKNKKYNIYLYWKNLQSVYIYLSTVSIICTYYLIDPFIYLWLGKDFILPKLTTVLILLNLFMNLSKIMIDTFKFASGFFEDTYAPALESFINLSVSLILVRKMGLNGVILGTIVSNFVIIVILKPILVFKRCFDKTLRNYIKDFSGFILLSLLSQFLTSRLISLLKIEFSNILNWIEFIKKTFLLFFITSIFVCLLFLIHKNFRNFSLSIFKKLITRKNWR